MQSSVLNDQFLLVIKVLHSVLQSCSSLKGTQTRERRVIGVRVAGAVELLEGPLSRWVPWELRGSNPSTLAGSRGGLGAAAVWRGCGLGEMGLHWS